MSNEEEFEAMVGMLDHYSGNNTTDEQQLIPENTETTETEVVSAFHDTIDPKLVDAGWGFEAAKSVEHGKTDQSLVNHVRN